MAKLVSKVYGDALFETAMEKGLWILSTRKHLLLAPHFTGQPGALFPFSEIRRS